MKNEKMLMNVERYGPWIFAFVGSLVSIPIFNKYSLEAGFDKILDSSIMFSSIIVGFVGVLVGILFSLRDSELIQLFFETRTRGRERLKLYFKQNIISGILLVVFSMLLYLRAHLGSCVQMLALITWTFLLVFVFFSTYRIIDIIMHILFSANDKNENQELEGIKMDNQKRLDLEERFKKSNTQ